MVTKKLEKYLKEMLIPHEIDEERFLILNYDGEEREYLIVQDDTMLFDEDLNFIPTTEFMVDGYVYYFGGRWYLQPADEKEARMVELRYLGKAQQKLPTESFLGIHSGYELMNGIGLYKDWVNKAKFLGVKTLGCCEKHTLSGALIFQKECQKNGIKSIIGMSISIEYKKETFDAKLYVKDFEGWLNLLYFNSLINVSGQHSIKVEQLKNRLFGLFFVADPKSMAYTQACELVEIIDFYQLDTVNFLNEDKDKWYVDNLELFIKSGLFQPISITDAYYLEQDDFLTREALWTIGKSFDEKTDNQFFKNRDQYAKELISMFESGNNSWIRLFNQATKNERVLIEDCNFTYDTDTRHLPKYIMTEDEAKQFSSNDKLFIHLIKKGFSEKNFPKDDMNMYLERLKTEIDVLKKGDVIDYFLSLYDIVRYAQGEGMLTGIARGSAGGSLVAYLLGIIQINPLEFDLLFERFLNSGRMGEYQDRPSYELVMSNGSTIELAEGSLVRVIRDGEEKVLFIHEIKEGDDIIKY